MTINSHKEALSEIKRLRGTQFTDEAIQSNIINASGERYAYAAISGYLLATSQLLYNEMIDRRIERIEDDWMVA